MVSLAISAYIRHTKRNCFIILQLTVLFIVLLVTVTTICEEYRWYRPVADWNGKKGFVVEASGCHGDTKDSLTKGMDKVDSVMSFGYGNAVSPKNEGYSNFLAYPDSLINDFRPELESGDWLDKKDASDDEIEVVVSKNPYGWKTGSHINLGYYDENGEIHSFKAMVCGVLKEGISVIGSNIGSSQLYRTDYRDLYSTYSYQQSEYALVLMRENQAIQNHIPMTYNQKYIIAVQDDTTEKELLQIESTLRKNIAGYGASDVCVLSPLERFMKNSNHEFQQTVMMYLPVFICVLCITIISVINVCTLNLSEDMRENAVFSVLGLPWRKNGLFSLIQIIITNVISLMLVMMFLILAERTKISEYVYIQLDFWSTVLLILVVVCVCLVYYFVASRMLKKKNPVELLRSDL